MFCLLCHEKISRLRAWRTKSEFCCDEHAEVYKRQTLERLLTDHENGTPAVAPPLPVDAGPDSVHADEAEAQTGSSAVLARFREQDAPPVAEQRLEPLPESELLDRGESDEGLQELWRLAEEVSPASAESDDYDWDSVPGTLSEVSSQLESGGFGGAGGGLGSSLGGLLGKGLGRGSGGVREQTPEEALAALRSLSGGSERSAGRLDEPGDEVDTLLSARAMEATPEEELELGADSEELAPALLDDALAGEESLPLLDAASLEPLDDDELPSILARLTDFPSEAHAPEAEEFGLAAAAADEKFAEELQPAGETGAELEQPVAAAQHEQAASPDLEVPAAAADPDEPGALDLIEAAVELHLEESEELSSQRGSSHKVVPFPLSRPKTASRDESEEAPWTAGQPAASAAGERARPRKPGKGFKASKGMTGDLSRLQLRPVAVMFGIEPSLHAPEADASEWLPGDLGARPGVDAIVEPRICYPDAGGGRRAGARWPIHARLFPLLPEAPESEPVEGVASHAGGPDYRLPCETPLGLAAGCNGNSGRPSVGSERAWMFQIDPVLAEGPQFELQLPNGQRHAPWQAPKLPAALLSGVAHSNGSGRLDLSGPQGKFEPPVDRLCLVFPELGELGGGVPRQPSKGPGEELGRWTPPSVLDPRFDIERPAGRDLSDFG